MVSVLSELVEINFLNLLFFKLLWIIPGTMYFIALFAAATALLDNLLSDGGGFIRKQLRKDCESCIIRHRVWLEYAPLVHSCSRLPVRRMDSEFVAVRHFVKSYSACRLPYILGNYSLSDINDGMGTIEKNYRNILRLA